MTLRPDSKTFRRQLGVWSLRGVFCAAPSFCWALHLGVTGRAAILAMTAGVVTYVIAFAWCTALPAYRERVEPGHFGWSLRVAANVRAALSILLLGMPDMWLGMCSVAVVRWDEGAIDRPGLALFGATYLTTLVQGALVSATMLLVALIIWLARALWRRREAQLTLP
jgi:hypothetical protein